jgi:hypothetical protein
MHACPDHSSPHSPPSPLFIHYDEVTAAFTRVMMGADSLIWQLHNKRSPFNNNWTWLLLLLLPFAGQNITGHKFQPH